jgi:hypothetical protein
MYFRQIALSTSNPFFTAILAKHYTKINRCPKGTQTYFFLFSEWKLYYLGAMFWNLYVLVAEGWNLYILGTV